MRAQTIPIFISNAATQTKAPHKRIDGPFLYKVCCEGRKAHNIEFLNKNFRVLFIFSFFEIKTLRAYTVILCFESKSKNAVLLLLSFIRLHFFFFGDQLISNGKFTSFQFKSQFKILLSLFQIKFSQQALSPILQNEYYGRVVSTLFLQTENVNTITLTTHWIN